MNEIYVITGSCNETNFNMTYSGTNVIGAFNTLDKAKKKCQEIIAYLQVPTPNLIVKGIDNKIVSHCHVDDQLIPFTLLTIHKLVINEVYGDTTNSIIYKYDLINNTEIDYKENI